MTKILLVEDEAPLREKLKEVLAMFSFDVAVAKNGVEALKLMQSYMPDVIVSDIKMAEMDGYSFLKNVKELPKGCRIPFIFITAKSNVDEMRFGMELGADDYLVKPFSTFSLVNAINTRIARVKELRDQYNKEKDDDALLEKLRDKLSKRELDIIRLIDQGLTSFEIADKLSISKRTVDNHRANILSKLGGKGTSDLIRILISMK